MKMVEGRIHRKDTFVPRMVNLGLHGTITEAEDGTATALLHVEDDMVDKATLLFEGGVTVTDALEKP